MAAATRLHEDQGVLTTSWEEIAREAGVAPATAYRHFPSLAELVPACAQSVFDVARPPTIEEAQGQFERLGTVRERFIHLATESARCYEKGEAWLHAARRERDLLPSIDHVISRHEEALKVLVLACLAPRKVGRRAIELLCVLNDFPFWKSIVEAGVPRREAVNEMLLLITAVLQREGIE